MSLLSHRHRHHWLHAMCTLHVPNYSKLVSAGLTARCPRLPPPAPACPLCVFTAQGLGPRMRVVCWPATQPSAPSTHMFPTLRPANDPVVRRHDDVPGNRNTTLRAAVMSHECMCFYA